MENTKTTFARNVEIVTNFAIIAVAIVGATVLVKNYLLRSPAHPSDINHISADSQAPTGNSPAKPASRGPREGTQLSLNGIDWNASPKTVVLALSSKCHFCSESAPFYQRLTNELAQKPDVRLVAVFPQDGGEAKNYLTGLGVKISEVKQASLDTIEVGGTPTLMIVDSHGTVKQSWVGKLSPEKESEVLVRVKA